MKKLSTALFLVAFLLLDYAAFAQEQWKWNQITVIESVVPGGVGRSRMISNNEEGKLEETKLQNFFSVTGINFGNVNLNDIAITQKINNMVEGGWELYDVTSGVYSGNDGKNGIFITRYLFRKPK